MLSSSCLTLLALASVFTGVFSQSSLPQVDLGYEIHQAFSFNETAQTYNFSNIRFAQPPVGDLRFAAPVAPTGRNTEVQTGSVGRICPQANPAWEFIASELLTDLIVGNASSFNYTQAQQQLQAYLASGAAAAPPDPRTTEDCLFLDLVVPKAVFDNANNKHWKRNAQGKGGAPVLVWIYGGGYTAGSKAGTANPGQLIATSQAAGGQGIIFVTMNYRLGALGWLAGPTLQAAGGVSNAGLYDQRLAIEWVSKYIHLFGGDPGQITLIGESAGGGSIEHQITAFGGEKPVSFQRAIPQSPGWLPITSSYVQENTTQNFLALLNVSTIAEARQLSSTAVITANTLQVGAATYGDFVYGPVVDGVFVPALPGLLLNAGAFAKGLGIMAAHNANEGPLFTPPYVQSNSDLAAFFHLTYPGIQDSVVSYISNILYPPIYTSPSPAHPYTNPFQRTSLIIAESIFTCNTHYLAKAYGNKTYNYEFQVPPAFHGFDVPYTFYQGTGTNASTGLFAPVAEVLQTYIVNFVMTGNPNGPVGPVPPFPMQGMNASMNAVNVTGIMPVTDDTANARCEWWQKALYT